MSIENVFCIGIGLVVLGLFFFLLDFVMIRLLVKAGASEPETWKSPLTLPPDTSKEEVRRYQLTEAMMTHRFRRGGICTVVAGLLILAGCALWLLFG